jgi:hypothetical protein
MEHHICTSGRINDPERRRMIDQGQQRQYPSHRGNRSRETWNDEDYRALRRLARGGESLALISRRLGRSPEAVSAVARRLGVLILAQRCRIPAVATPDEARARLRELATDNRESLAALSRMIRRRSGYLSSFLNEGTPHMLAAADCRMLAAFFSVPATDLGGEYVEAAPQKTVAQAKGRNQARPCEWGA